MKTVVGGLLLGLLLANFIITPKKLARKIEGFLSTRLPGVQDLQVEVRGPRGVRALRGKFDSLVLRGRGSNVEPLADELLVAMTKVRYKNGVGHIKEVKAYATQFVYGEVDFEQASVTLYNVAFGAKEMVQQRKVSNLIFERAEAVASLGKTGVDQLGLSLLKKKGVMEPAIYLRDGYLEVTGKRRAPFVGEVTMRATGKLIGKGNELHVVDVQVTAGSNPLPESVVKSLTKDLNPLYVFDEDQSLPFTINLRTVTITPERLTAEGEFVFKKAEG